MGKVRKNHYRFNWNRLTCIPAMASLSESIFAIFIIIGFYTRASTFLLGFTMMVAFNKHLFSDGFKSGEMALLYLILCIIVYLLGPGKFSIDRLIKK